MRNFVIKSGILVLGLLGPISLLNAQCDARQTFNGEEDSCLDYALSPPPKVIAAILDTDEAKQAVGNEALKKYREIANHLQAYAIHLRNDQQKDMIVRGTPPLSGADNTWFWVVTSIDHNPIATFINGNSVTLLKSRHNGYRDIQTDWCSAAYCSEIVYRYNGKRFVRFHEATQTNQ